MDYFQLDNKYASLLQITSAVKLHQLGIWNLKHTNDSASTSYVYIYYYHFFNKQAEVKLK